MSHEWDAHATWWQDEFSQGADPEYEEQIIPLVRSLLPDAGAALDVGCGEGQMARTMADAGLSVIGVDPSGQQVSVAAQRGGGVRYAEGSAERLPVRSDSIDVVLACLVFEHVKDPTGGLGEIARVLRPGGRFIHLLNHPLLQTPESGWIEDFTFEPPIGYWQVGPYLPHSEVLEEVNAGVFVRFFHRPMSFYVNSCADVGLRLTRMYEPAPPPGFLARSPGYARGADIPRLLGLVYERG